MNYTTHKKTKQTKKLTRDLIRNQTYQSVVILLDIYIYIIGQYHWFDLQHGDKKILDT